VIRLRPAASRGRFRDGWLDARFSFNFGSYREPGFDGYSDLLVLNEDLVAPGGGFAEHPHADVEVMSYPLSGVIRTPRFAGPPRADAARRCAPHARRHRHPAQRDERLGLAAGTPPAVVDPRRRTLALSRTAVRPPATAERRSGR
jgi:hypothetical protein